MPRKLPVISGEELVRALAKIGYTTVRQKGSHVRLHCEGRTPVTVPLHDEIRRGTLQAILRAIELDTEQLLELLE